MDKEVTDGNISDTIEPTENTNIDEIQSTSYRYVFYIILLLIIGLFILWILISLFSSEPPLLIINQMLNNTLEITTAGD